MTLANLIKDLLDTSRERLKTPISGAFILSFVFYNWRPIAELFFSRLAIEDRIYIIDQEYCDIWAIIVPLVIAFIYIIGAPMLMVKIDKILIKTKKSRVDNIYESKGHIIDKKITLAGKEFQLKNAESGNKEVQDMLDQINALKQTNQNIIESNKNVVSQLNGQLEESNKMIQVFKDYTVYDDDDDRTNQRLDENMNEFHDSQKRSEYLDRLKSGKLTRDELKLINSLTYNIDGYIDNYTNDLNSSITNNFLKDLQYINVINRENKGLKFTEYGMFYLNRINRSK